MRFFNVMAHLGLGPDIKDVRAQGGGRGVAQKRHSMGGWIYCTEIGKKAWLFAKLQPGRARKRINAI